MGRLLTLDCPQTRFIAHKATDMDGVGAELRLANSLANSNPKRDLSLRNLAARDVSLLIQVRLDQNQGTNIPPHTVTSVPKPRHFYWGLTNRY
jgi:hypothetical protein